MRKHLLALLAVVVLVAVGACADNNDNDSDDGATSDGSGAESSAKTYTVDVDGKSTAFSMATTAYFPHQLKVAAGSTVDFKSIFTGEPHTVTLGTLVDEGAAKLASTPQGEEPEAWKKLPALLPQGPGDANQMAANPCVVASGDPPADKACPKVGEMPAFDGKQSVYSSGFLPEGASFEVKLADDIKAGTYTFFCLLHRAGMTGELTVVDDADADTPEEVTKAGEDELAAMVKALTPANEQASKGDATPFAPAAPGQVVVGGASPDVQNGLLTGFGPKEVSIKTGGVVKFVVVGPHTISFNAPESVASSAIIKGPDGAFHANEQAFAPQGGPGQPPPPDTPPADNAPPPAPRVTDGGKFDGTGFRSSGIFVSFPPALDAYTLTFTKAGTFPYKCIIHPGMEGTVKVG
jgi:plastocyanin